MWKSILIGEPVDYNKTLETKIISLTHANYTEQSVTVAISTVAKELVANNKTTQESQNLWYHIQA